MYRKIILEKLSRMSKDSKYEIAIKCTKPLPTKEERKKHKEEMLRRKAMENSGEVSQTEQ